MKKNIETPKLNTSDSTLLNQLSCDTDITTSLDISDSNSLTVLNISADTSLDLSANTASQLLFL